MIDLLTVTFLTTGILYFVSEIAYTVRDVIIERNELKRQEAFAELLFSQISSDEADVQDEGDTKQKKKNTKKAKA